MPNPPSRSRIRAVLIDQVVAAAEAAPMVAEDYGLGSSGVVVDLVVAAEEFIGFVVRGADDGLVGLDAELATCARYLDRVVLVVDVGQLPGAGLLDRAGAALWTVDGDGDLQEHAPGRANAIGPAALLDLMTPAHRAALLRPVLPSAAYDRSTPPVSAERIRQQLRGRFEPPVERYWSAMGAV